jgi:hypothetical protein
MLLVIAAAACMAPAAARRDLMSPQYLDTGECVSSLATGMWYLPVQYMYCICCTVQCSSAVHVAVGLPLACNCLIHLSFCNSHSVCCLVVSLSRLSADPALLRNALPGCKSPLGFAHHLAPCHAFQTLTHTATMGRRPF